MASSSQAGDLFRRSYSSIILKARVTTDTSRLMQAKILPLYSRNIYFYLLVHILFISSNERSIPKTTILYGEQQMYRINNPGLYVGVIVLS